jgi:hypothetical protein
MLIACVNKVLRFVAWAAYGRLCYRCQGERNGRRFEDGLCVTCAAVEAIWGNWRNGRGHWSESDRSL